MWQVHHYLTHKQGIAVRECEDALASSERSGACAVADGATEAFGARWWARLLVRGWVLRPQVEQAAFLELVTELARRAQRRWAARPLPWYAEEKRQQGSHAAFVGVRFERIDGNWRWRAIALGDSCLFHLRGTGLLLATPLSEPAQFGYRPQLVPTRPEALARCGEYIVESAGSAEAGDRLLLLSDAAACWFLQARADHDAAADQFLDLLQLGCGAGLDDLIGTQRQSGRMRNDDVAAMLLSFGPQP
jgi:hypothetical protein